MDSIDYANELVKEFGVIQGDALKAIDSEVDDLRADTFRIRKPSYKEALDAAYDSIREWLKTGAEEYVVKLDWEGIAQFAHSHRKACVWAVLTAKAKAAKASHAA
jgi:hypothetical protein